MDAGLKEAVARGRHSAWAGSFSPHAVRFFLREGWELFARLENCPVGNERVFFRKTLADLPAEGPPGEAESDDSPGGDHGDPAGG